MANDHVIEVTDANFQSEVAESNVPVIIDFWAEWCGPCKMIAPLVEQLATQYQGKVRVGKLNVDHNPATAQRFRITGIPALLVFEKGEVVNQLIGAHPKQIQQLFETASA